MKKIIFCHAATCISALFIAQEVSSQSLINAVATTTAAAETVDPERNSAMPANTGSYYRNAISTRAVRGFLRDFKEARNVTWYKANEGGCSAKFVVDSVQTTVAYDQRGALNYILMRYAENKMPADVRAMVKSKFREYSIMEVTEFKSSIKEENINYSVLIKYATDYKVLKICKEKVEIVNEYSKL